MQMSWPVSAAAWLLMCVGAGLTRSAKPNLRASCCRRPDDPARSANDVIAALEAEPERHPAVGLGYAFGMDAELEPQWCIAANVRARPHGPSPDAAAGMRHFSAGAKLWLERGHWGDGYERAWAIGRHRGARDLMRIVVPIAPLCRFRAELVYKPAVLRRVVLPFRSEADAEGLAEILRARHPDEPGEPRVLGDALIRARRALDAEPVGRSLVAAAVDDAGLAVLADWLGVRDVTLPRDLLVDLVRRVGG